MKPHWMVYLHLTQTLSFRETGSFSSDAAHLPTSTVLEKARTIL